VRKGRGTSCTPAVLLELWLTDEELTWRAAQPQRKSLNLVWQGAFRRGSFTHMDFDTLQQRLWSLGEVT